MRDKNLVLNKVALAEFKAKMLDKPSLIDAALFNISKRNKNAPVAELVDATDSKSVFCMEVGVRVSLGAPFY